MQLRVLDQPPVSGSIEEQQFEAYGDCTWVEFNVGDIKWAGVFGNGHVLKRASSQAAISQTAELSL
jgi:hypothetical protein